MRTQPVRPLRLALWLCLVAICWAPRIHAEGSAELGGGSESLEAETLLFVDIIDASTETILWQGGEDIEVFDPLGASLGVFSNGETITPTPGEAGAYRIELQAGVSGLWDVSVLNPAAPGGRLYSINWVLFGGGFEEVNAISTSFYAIVPGGGPGLDAVVEMRFEGLAGFGYKVNANSQGVDGPDAGRSVPTAGQSVTPEYSLYLNPPTIAQHGVDAPIMSNLSVGSGPLRCPEVVPGGAYPAEFELDSNIAGTFHLICDVDQDGQFGLVEGDDFLLIGTITPGQNTIEWSGVDGDGALLSPGASVDCLVRINVGEFHYVAEDIETVFPGLRIFFVDAAGARSPLTMFWNDERVQASAVDMGGGLFGAETSSNAGMSSGDPLTPTLPNINARSWGDFTGQGKGNNTFLDTFAWVDSAGAPPMTLTLTDGTIDGDSDGITDYVERCVLGSDPATNDSDGDGLLDGVEAPGGVSVDSDSDGVADFLDTDDDNDGIDTAIEVAESLVPGSDVDGDGLANWLDVDADGDGFEDAEDGLADLDGDGIVAFLDPDEDALTDEDGDGIPSALELALGLDPTGTDSDGDGIPDGVEAGAGPTDTDNDGVIDALDLDSDGDGRLDLIEGQIDSDRDGLADFLDADDDGDGIPTRQETIPFDPAPGEMTDAMRWGEDVDNDGIINALDIDSDNDGLLDADEGAGDSDGDSIPDYLDDAAGGGLDGDPDGDGLTTEQELALGSNPLVEDSDGDSLPDALEVGDTPGMPMDTDGDGIPDIIDDDDDGDGILTLVELNDGVIHGGDRDEDGVPNYLDIDSDGDGLLDLIETNEDTDGGGIPNYLDFDSDNDGTLDAVELDGDVDNDGVVNYRDPDDSDGPGADPDGDTLINSVEQALGTDPYSPDSDVDRIGDLEEVGDPANPVDSDGDGLIDAIDPDDDDDGIPTALEVIDAALHGVDLDGDGVPHHLDLDSDGDGLSDLFEGRRDTDRDGLPDYLDLDSDGDGRADVDEGIGDDDLDGVANSRDPDDGDGPDADADGDGLSNAVEIRIGTLPYRRDTDRDGLGDGEEVGANPLSPRDTDGDGLIDALDFDDDGDGILTPTELEDEDRKAEFDVDGDGLSAHLDLDSDGDGFLDRIEGERDWDGDGIPDYLDADSDNDGILDSDEGEGDLDGDGLTNRLDAADDTPTPPTDLDGDGLNDVDEAALGTNPNSPDSDGDGLCDGDRDVEAACVSGEIFDPLAPLDTDGDGLIDALDADDDEDGIPTLRERDDAERFGADVDGDGVSNWLDTDSDGDGLDDRDEGLFDLDRDGVPDYLQFATEPPEEDIVSVMDDPMMEEDTGSFLDVVEADAPSAPNLTLEGGCACRVRGSRSPSDEGALGLFALLGLICLRRRR